MPRGSRPGERRGGRKKGTPDKRTKARYDAIAAAGVTPLQYLLQGLGYWHEQIRIELAKGADASEERLAAAFAADKEFARDAAPYCHSRLASVDHSGRVDLDLTRLTEEQFQTFYDLYHLALPAKSTGN